MVTRFSGKLATVYKYTRRQKPEHQNQNLHRPEDIKSHIP